MAELSSFDSARQTFARLRKGGGGRGFGGGAGGRGFGGGGRGFGGGGGGRGFGRRPLNWHGKHGWGRGLGYYPYYAGLYSYPYYESYVPVPVAVDSSTCNAGPAAQQLVTFYNGSCVEDAPALERFASELNCCAGTVVRPMPGSTCQSNGDVSQRAYHCAYH